jgi:hypothetical protein
MSASCYWQRTYLGKLVSVHHQAAIGLEEAYVRNVVDGAQRASAGHAIIHSPHCRVTQQFLLQRSILPVLLILASLLRYDRCNAEFQ